MSAFAPAASAAADTPPPPLDPQVASALSDVEASGAILALWLPMAVFAHVFAFGFLIHGLFLYMPGLKRKLSPRVLLEKYLARARRRRSDLRANCHQSAPQQLQQQGQQQGQQQLPKQGPDGRSSSSQQQNLGSTKEEPPPEPPSAGGSADTAEPSHASSGPHVKLPFAEGALPPPAAWNQGTSGSRTVTAPAGMGKAEGVGDLEGGDEDVVEDLEAGDLVTPGAGPKGVKGVGVAGGVGSSESSRASSLVAELRPASVLQELAMGYDEASDGGGVPGQVCLEWRGITLAVAAPRGVATVLQDVGGRAPPSALTAILGPSGAGKSTLLDLLALRGAASVPERPGEVTRAAEALQARQPACAGEVLVNGEPRDRKSFLQMSSYVPQVDAFLPQLTVREALMFTGRLVLRPPQCGKRQVAARAAAAAAALGLSPHMNNMIGGVLPGGLLLRGLSGGERKRLSIGQGLMSRPRVLLLDEPTSGLDSFAAAVVVGHMAALAAGLGAADGVTVVAALHQPRAAIWEQINQVVVLGRGRLLYCGPPYQLLPWFRDRLGYCYSPEHHGLASDWVMDLLAMPEVFISDESGGNKAMANETKGNAIADGDGVDGSAVTSNKTRVDDVILLSQRGRVRLGSEARDAMRSVAELYAAADAFKAAVLAAPPAPGVSPGVPDYANVLAPTETAAAQEQQIMVEGSELTVPAATGWAAAGETISGNNAVSATPPSGGAGTAASEGTRNAAAPGSIGGGIRTVHVPTELHGQGAVLYPPLPRAKQHLVDGELGKLAAGRRRVAPPTVRRTAAAAAASLQVWFRQFRMLVWREWLMATRNPADVAGRMLTFVWVGLFASFLTYSLPADATSILQRCVMNFSMCFFFIVMPFIFMSLFSADKRFFLLEASARGGGGAGGLYTPSAYYAAKVTAVTPLNIIIAITFDWIGYGMLGFRHSVLSLVQNTVLAVLMSLISLQWVQAAVAFTPNQDLAFCASIAFVVLNLLLSTQFLGTFKMTIAWIGRLRAISALDHAWRGITKAEFRGRAFPCGPVGTAGMLGTDAMGLFPQFLPDNPQYNLVRYGMTTKFDNCVVDTDALLSYYKINVSIGTTIGYLFAYLAVVHVLTYLALCHAVRPRGIGGGSVWPGLRVWFRSCGQRVGSWVTPRQ